MGRSPRALPLGSVSPRFYSSCGPRKTWPAPLTSGFGMVSTMVGPQNPTPVTNPPPHLDGPGTHRASNS